MKKSVKVFIVVISVCIVAVIVGALVFSDVFTRYDDTIDGEFSINDYYFQHIIDGGHNSIEGLKKDYFDYYGTERDIDISDNVGPVNDAATARKEAVKVWNELYGRWDIKGEKPYHVYYDSENEVWYIHGTLYASLGGVAEILIGKNGDIIAVWHGK